MQLGTLHSNFNSHLELWKTEGKEEYLSPPHQAGICTFSTVPITAAFSKSITFKEWKSVCAELYVFQEAIAVQAELIWEKALMCCHFPSQIYSSHMLWNCHNRELKKPREWYWLLLFLKVEWTFKLALVKLQEHLSVPSRHIRCELDKTKTQT